MAVGFGLMGVRRGAALLTVTGLLLCASSTQAVVALPASCFNDTDCPNQACGGEVCNWNLISPNPSDPNKPYVCNPAGSAPKGTDGWCTTDENCKCLGQGAKCIAPYCSFTKASDAPGGVPVHGGMSSVAGNSSAGSPSAAGSASGGTGSTSTPTPPTSEPMGRDDTTERTAQACSMRGAAGGGDFWAALTVFLGITAAFAARRKRRGRIPT